MRYLINITLLTGLLLAACNGPVQPNKKSDTITTDKPHIVAKPKQKQEKRTRLPMAINTLLSHKRTAFRCDSAVIVTYDGLVNGHTYFPVHEDGVWLKSITKRKRLNVRQLKVLNSILGNSGSFKKPESMTCYEPAIGVVYFKDGRVIGQSAISLTCAMVKSTAQLGNNNHHASLNKKALKRLEKFVSVMKW